MVVIGMIPKTVDTCTSDRFNNNLNNMSKAKVTLTKVFRGEQETPYGLRTKVGIKIQEEDIILEDGRSANVADKWLTMLAKPGTTTGTEEWETGASVEIEISEKKGYYNFKVVGNSLEDRVKKLEDTVFGAKIVKEDEPLNIDDVDF
jgi:hypothetical protein